MRRLHEHQTVELDLESEPHAFTCRVESIAGAVATLIPARHMPASGIESAASGYLLFQHHASVIALRGIATTVASHHPKLDFVVTDGVVLPERRRDTRVPLVARGRVATIDERSQAPAWFETFTSNISHSGALLERPPHLADTSQLTVELLGEHDPTPIRSNVEVIRRTPRHLAVRFTNLGAEDRTRLAIIIDRHQRSRPVTVRDHPEPRSTVALSPGRIALALP